MGNNSEEGFGILLWLRGRWDLEGLGGGSWGSLWLTVSPPDLQGQQPVVVGDSVLSSREEARIESRVIFVPAETQWSVVGSGSEQEGSRASWTWIPTSALCCLLTPVTWGSTFPALNLGCPHL